MKIYVIRHGETEYNEQGKIQGHIDIPLSPEGVRQAASTAKRLTEHIDRKCLPAVYSSDLERSRQTASAFTDLLKKMGQEITVQYMSELREIDLGAWQGRTREELLADKGDDNKSLFAMWLDDPSDIIPEDGESMPDFFRRTVRILHEIIDENKNRECTVVIFTHSGNLSMILNHLHGNKPVNFVKYSIDNASGVILEYKDDVLEEVGRI
jgi:broad specificity phosphatase PhoE